MLSSYQLFPRASSRMEEVTKTKGVEIARLTAQLRKAEMMVSSLERQVDQKVGGQIEHKSYSAMNTEILL